MNDTCEPLLINAVRELPVLPAAVLELLDMLGRDDVETSELVARISLDQALTAKTLRLANSSFYGMPRHVASVTDATTVLGLRTVRAVVTAAALAGSFKPPACKGFDFMAFWRHAVNTAVSARLVAAEVGADSDAAFTAGLLHDIGQLVLASAFPERFAVVLAHRAEADIALRDAELALLGIDHATVGASVAERWRFPQAIVEVIGDHHTPRACATAFALVRIVHVADHLARVLEHGAGGGDVPLATCHGAWTELGLPAEAWARIVAEAELQTQILCAALLT
ncbi:MAG: HDOD domain-containing protein [Bacteriovorax sp.]|nr:HDOD domain-containing protein [Rhizobacter sp.]